MVFKEEFTVLVQFNELEEEGFWGGRGMLVEEGEDGWMVEGQHFSIH